MDCIDYTHVLEDLDPSPFDHPRKTRNPDEPVLIFTLELIRREDGTIEWVEDPLE